MKKGTKEEIKSSIYLELDNFYSIKGYQLTRIRRARCLVKDAFEVHFGLAKEYPDTICLSPSLSVINKEIKTIKDILFPESPNITTYARQDKDLVTLMGSQYELPPDFQYYEVSLETDFRAVVDDHMSFMHAVGFDYLEQFSTLEKIDNYFSSMILDFSIEDFAGNDYNTNMKLISKLSGIREVRSGLIAAYLNNNPRLEDLRHKYKEVYGELKINNILDDISLIENYFSENPVRLT